MLTRIWYSLRNRLRYKVPRRTNRAVHIMTEIENADNQQTIRYLLTMLYLDSVGLHIGGTTPKGTYLTPCQLRAAEAVAIHGYECGVIPAPAGSMLNCKCPEQIPPCCLQH